MLSFKSLMGSAALSIAIVSSTFASNPDCRISMDDNTCAGTIAPATVQADDLTSESAAAQTPRNMDLLVQHLSSLPDEQKCPQLLLGLPGDLVRSMLVRLEARDLVSLVNTSPQLSVAQKLMWYHLQQAVKDLTGSLENLKSTGLPLLFKPWSIAHSDGILNCNNLHGDYTQAFLASQVYDLETSRHLNLPDLRAAAARVLDLAVPMCEMVQDLPKKRSALLAVQAVNLILATPSAVLMSHARDVDAMGMPIAGGTLQEVINPRYRRLEQLGVLSLNFLADGFYDPTGGGAFSMTAKYHAVDINPIFSQKLRQCCIIVNQMHPNSQLADLSALTYARVVMRTYPRTMDEVRFAANAMCKIKDYMFMDANLVSEIAQSLVSNGIHRPTNFRTGEMNISFSQFSIEREIETNGTTRDDNTKTNDFSLLCALVDHCSNLGIKPESLVISPEDIDTKLVLALFGIANPEALEMQKKLFIERHLDKFFK